MNIIAVELESVLPSVKPPSFANIGISSAFLPWGEGRTDVLLNTAQATANKLEEVLWDPVNNRTIEALQGMPYIQIINAKTGEFAASTLTIPHRIGTGYLARHKDAKLDGKPFPDELRARIERKGIYQAVFELDPISIIFGCFLSHINGVYRIPRTITGQFVAQNAIPLPTGGASHDPIVASGDMIKNPTDFGGKKKLSKVGLGNIPYVRESYTAERYQGKFVIDSRLVRRSGLGDLEGNLIETLAEFCLVKFLSEPIALRTECYLSVKQIVPSTPLRTLSELEAQLQAQIQALTKQNLWEGVTTVEIPIDIDPTKGGEDSN